MAFTDNDSYPWQPGHGQMNMLSLRTANGAVADIYLHGAHLTSWRTANGREWIFLSQDAQFAPGNSIRGGVPLIFPQFNERGTGPRHGFARTSEWTPTAPPVYSEKSVSCTFALTANDSSLQKWPHRFAAHYTVEVQDERLQMRLAVENIDDRPFTFTAALHTYLKLQDLHTARLHGLQGLSFWDNDGSDFSQRSCFGADELTFSGALDRVYFESKAPLLLRDGDDILQISSEGFGDVVVWNPGPEAAAALADMRGDEYRQMLCVEAARIDQPITLNPGQSWSGVQTLKAQAPF